jgi:hypothetical protein
MDDQEGYAMPRWMVGGLAALVILAVAGAGFGWHNYSAINRLDQGQQSAAAEMKTSNEGTGQQIAALEQKLADVTAANTNLQSDLEVVTRRLRVTQNELQQARKEATQIREASEQQLAALDTNVKSELATKASADELKNVNGVVTVVKTDLETTKNDLKMARSELGTLIARNHEEINVLRRLGERDYVEFSITGRKKPQRVGAVTVELRSVDVKRNKYTVAMMVDDVRTEKKDRLVNEPVFFYPRGSKTPSELVVNSIAKDKITGYISSPKLPALSASASTN